ncbi:hypothetical protein ONZ51_g13516 [Trametes cubensis]|uniref:AMP-dependent synthetase/ligase domain-containing protein n=1 Tax=Trametes cubensis TaxID=1111947 RepID=A0AAD7X5V6_9APHY|nr:hypothetical protein ONZ51_g13516 [Trametes cubensis]
MPLNAIDLPPHITVDFHAPKELLAQGTTAPELYDWHAKENPSYPLFMYHDGGKHEYITYAVANLAIDRAARYIASWVGHTPKGDAERPTVAVLANTDTITYFCTVIGVMRAGYTVFLVSTRNGPAGVADMLQKTNASQMLISPDVAVRQVAHDTIGLLPAGQLTLQTMPTFEDLFPKDSKSVDKAFEGGVELPETYDPNAYALILHSSETVYGGFKDPPGTRNQSAGPIDGSHRSAVALVMSYEVDTSRSVMGCHGTLLSHGLGAFLYVGSVSRRDSQERIPTLTSWPCAGPFSRKPVNGYVVAAFKPQTPPRMPIPSAVWEGLATTKCDYAWAAWSITYASYEQEWARDPDKVHAMRQMRGVFFGGAPLASEIGDALASQGVNLYTVYGLTEVGMVNLPVRPNMGLDWSYFCTNPGKQVRFVSHGDNKFEVVILSDSNLPLPIINMKYEGQDAYATGDLVVPHDTVPGLWTIFGRTDEQIILSNGEKVSSSTLHLAPAENVAYRAS